MRWIGVALIAGYWSSAWWLPQIARVVGLHPDTGDRLQQLPMLVRVLEVYHWPHVAAMRLPGPVLQRDAFFARGWVLVLTQVIPMIATALAWWLIVRLIDKRSRHQWAAST